jgi:hypothetical protein
VAPVVEQILQKRQRIGGRWQKGRRKKELKSVGLKPRLERKKLGKRDDHRLLNQNSFFQSHVFRRGSILPSAFYLLPSEPGSPLSIISWKTEL